MKRLLTAILLIGTSAVAEAQLTPEQEAAFQERLTRWVQEYYPQLIGAKGLDPKTMVAFIVDRNDRVLDNGRGLQADYTQPVPVVDEVKRFLPKWKSTKFVGNGAACFGSPKDGSKYCVIYGVAGK